VDDFDFNTYVKLLTQFANEDLSAFFFDIRKDCLYCDVNPATGTQTDKRRAYRTVLDILFNAMVRYAAPVLVFTAEEIWGTRFPDAVSVHLLEWPILPKLRHSRESGNPAPETSSLPDGPAMDPRLRGGDELVEKWTFLRGVRTGVNENIEPLRRDKTLGSSLEASVVIYPAETDQRALMESIDLAELCIVSECAVDTDTYELHGLQVQKTTHHKCGRCWRHLPEVIEDGALCGRCEDVLNG
jgi:isoleucyl-tRNA synthetase